MSEQQGVPWKWVAVTAVGILVALIGGIFSYVLNANSNQIKDLKDMIKSQGTRITTLTDRLSNSESRISALEATAEGLRRAVRRHGRPKMYPPAPPRKIKRSIHLHLPPKKK